MTAHKGDQKEGRSPSPRVSLVSIVSLTLGDFGKAKKNAGVKEYKSRVGSGALGRTSHSSGDQTTQQSETRAQVISRKPKCRGIKFLKVPILGCLALVRLVAGVCGKPDGTISRYPVLRILSGPLVLSPIPEA